MKYDSTNHKLKESWIKINQTLNKLDKEKSQNKRITSENKTFKDILTLVDKTTTTYTSYSLYLTSLYTLYTYAQTAYFQDWLARCW